MAAALQRAWLRRGALAWLLRPVSLLFALLAGLRRAAYRHGWLRSDKLAVPVIVIGNVVAGGAGKTPVVIAVLRHLQSRGIAAGVVARGWGRATSDCREVTHDAKADAVGDEPLLVARRTGAPVFVAPRRVDAGRALLAAYPRTQLIVSDDGLQHYAMRRDIEVCVFDDRGTGNGWLLPAGPLREPWPRPVDFVLRTGGTAELGGWQLHRRLGAHALRADGGMVELASLLGRPLVALAGIATPEAFFGMLRAAGLTLAQTLALADHHAFDQDPAPGEQVLLCTEKDAVKLWRLRPDALAVPLELEIDPAFWRELDRMVDAKLSSPHGPQAA